MGTPHGSITLEDLPESRAPFEDVLDEQELRAIRERRIAFYRYPTPLDEDALRKRLRAKMVPEPIVLD